MSERNIKEYENKYFSSPFTEINSKYRRKCVFKQMEKYLHSKILEIGCGYYPLFKDINKEEYTEWKIIEPSSAFVENVNQIIDKMGFDCVKVERSLFEDAVIDDRYDFVICSSLLHEVENPSLLLSKIYDVLGDNGVAHINVPNAYSFHRLLAVQMGLISDVFTFSDRNNLLQQNKIFDIKMLKGEVENCGFHIVDEGGFFIKPFTHKQMQEMYDANILTDKMIDGLYEMTEYMPEYASEIFVNVKKKL